METMLETIDLDIEEASELLFKVKVEGIDPSPVKVRLVCESGDVALMFNGHPTPDDGVVQFLLPSLKDRLKEGLYHSRVEVLIENRYFSPVEFNINFKKAVTVVAESMQVPQRRAVPQVKVTASPIAVKRPEAQKSVPPAPVAPKPAIIEAPVKQKVVNPDRTVEPVNRKAAPPPTKFNSGLTLKERYNSKLDERHEPVIEVDESDESLLRELAHTFINSQHRK